MDTLGKRISELRREKGLTQDDVAEKLHVSPQAVSKWENDQTCPDISLLPDLSKILGVSVDHLLTGENKDALPDVRFLTGEEKKDLKDMILRIEVDSGDGDRIRVNLPVGIVQLGIEMGMSMPEISINSDILKNIDIKKILEAASIGAVGNIIDVESADGDRVRMFIE